MTRAAYDVKQAAADLLERTTKAQGLPQVSTDESSLRRVAVIVRRVRAMRETERVAS